MAFEDLGPSWDRDEPWQVQQARNGIRGLTDQSAWMRHQRRVLIGGITSLAC